MRPPAGSSSRAWVAPRTTRLRVFMRGLRLHAEIGLHPHERGRTQPLVVDVDVDLAPHPITRLGDTLNYETLETLARALAARGHIDLVETYAQELAAAVLRSEGAVRVRVRVQKPEALADVEAAGVEIELEAGFG